MNMAVHDSLARNLAAVHAHVKALNSFISSEYIVPCLIKKHIDRAPLRIVKVEVGDGVASRHNQRVQRSDRVGIVKCEG